MRLIKKEDLTLIDGYLVDKAGELIQMNKLAKEVNELIELQELQAFLRMNKADILGSDKTPVVYRPADNREQPHRLASTKTAATPILDEEQETAIARAQEFLELQNVVDIDRHLQKYTELARWFEHDYIIVPSEPPVMPVKFIGDVLVLTEEQVVSIVEATHGEEMTKLLRLVTIDWS